MKTNEHGGDIYSQEIALDFSANINPLGMPESVKKILAENVETFSAYPDVNCTELKNAISEREKTSPEKIVCGNGAADLIYRIVHTLKPKKALVTAPTFSEYEKALKSENCIVNYYFTDKQNFQPSDDILSAIDGNEMFFLCNPNNPTGTVLPNNLTERVIERCGKCGCMLVIDECFMDFVSESEIYETKPAYSNVIILKAFTKIYAMAGLRLGYMLCADNELCRRVQNCGQCWSVSVPAQLAGTAAVKDRKYVEHTVQLITEERTYLTESLNKFGLKVYHSEANFILFKCVIPLDRLLLKEKIAIRSCENYYGLEYGYFRIAVRSHVENVRLIRAIESVISNG